MTKTLSDQRLHHTTAHIIRSYAKHKWKWPNKENDRFCLLKYLFCLLFIPLSIHGCAFFILNAIIILYGGLYCTVYTYIIILIIKACQSHPAKQKKEWYRQLLGEISQKSIFYIKEKPSYIHLTISLGSTNLRSGLYLNIDIEQS